jgi:NAD(P)-dependent dehydrogenase (short-subunit alcohol dehydrogenase family)
LASEAPISLGCDDLDMLLEGKVAIVTGAGSGIGRSSAQRFAAEGAAVLVADMRGEKAHKVADFIVTAGGRALPYEANVADPAQVEATVSVAIAELGGLDVVFCNAAASLPGTAVDLDATTWDLMWQTNVSSLFHAAKHAVPYMADHGGGSIVATASVSGLFPDANTVGYATTKAAIFGLVKALAVDHARQGVRVNCLCPGVTATPPMLAALGGGQGSLYDALIESQPLGRLGQPDELAAVAVWLASDEASYVTGQTIIADGGLTSESQFSRLIRMA